MGDRAQRPRKGGNWGGLWGKAGGETIKTKKTEGISAVATPGGMMRNRYP